MGKKIDHRPDWTGTDGEFEISSIESIETIGADNDYVVRLYNGDEHYFRCSCCITFPRNFVLLIK